MSDGAEIFTLFILGFLSGMVVLSGIGAILQTGNKKKEKAVCQNKKSLRGASYVPPKKS